MKTSFKMDDIPELDTIMKWMNEQICKTMPQEPTFQTLMEYWTSGNRTKYEEKYFKRRKQLTYLGLAAIHEPHEKKVITKLEDCLFSTCNEFTWCLPAHIEKGREFGSTKQYTLDLFACETAFTIAEMSELLKNELSKDLLILIKTTILERVILPFVENDWSFEKLENNWSAVCAGSIGITTLYLLEDDDPKKEPILDRTNKAMTMFLNSFGEDGACLEGVSYWQYGFRYFTYYIDFLKKSGYKKYAEALNIPKIKEIAAFQQKMYAYDKKIYNFSDAPDTLEPAFDLAYYYYEMYPEHISIPESSLEMKMLVDHCGRWAPAFRTLCWYRSNTKNKSSKSLVNWFADAQMITFKNSDIQFVAKGGTNHEPHNQNDIGHFMIYFRQKPLCIDLGAPVYTKDYFEENRYKVLQASSLGHSVPLINGHAQIANEDAEAKVIHLDLKDLMVVYDLKNAYEVASLTSYTREFKIIPDENRLRIRDNFQFNRSDNEIVERFIVSDLAKFHETDHGIRLIDGQNYLQIHCTHPNKQITSQRITYENHFGKVKTARIVSIEINLEKKNHMIDIDFCFGSNE